MVSVISPAWSAASSSDRSDSVRATGVLLFVIRARNTSRLTPVAHPVVDPRYADLHHVTGREQPLCQAESEFLDVATKVRDLPPPFEQRERVCISSHGAKTWLRPRGCLRSLRVAIGTSVRPSVGRGTLIGAVSSGMMSGVLVVLSGLPGAGKSAIADSVGRELRVPVLSVDPIEAAIWRCGIPPSFETGIAAYEVAAVLAEHQLGLGLTVITDSVSSPEVARDMWRQAAARAGSRLAIIEVICSDKNVHRQRMASRQRDIHGFHEPSWDDVQTRRAEWEPWGDDRLVVDTMRSINENVTDALDYLLRCKGDPRA